MYQVIIQLSNQMKAALQCGAEFPTVIEHNVVQIGF